MKIRTNEFGSTSCEHDVVLNLVLSTICYNKNCLQCTEQALKEAESRLLPAYKRERTELTEAEKNMRVPHVCIVDCKVLPTDHLPKVAPVAVNHEWVRQLIDACTSGNSHGNHVGNQVLCHRVAFQINKHFGLETREWNTDGDPEREPWFKDPYPKSDYLKEVADRIGKVNRHGR